MKSHLASSLALGILSLSFAAEAASTVRIAPVPAWVVPVPMPEREPLLRRENQPGVAGSSISAVVPSDAKSKYRFLVHDVQDKFTANQQEAFVHFAYVVEEPSDVQYGSELEANYNPNFEHLRLHYARIHRNSQTFDALSPAEIREISAESERERFQYDEARNVVVVLRDVRRGDAIEWAYSIIGQNPAVRGRVLAEPRLARNSAVKSLHVRLVVPRSSSASCRTHGDAPKPSITTLGDFTEYRWLQSDVMANEDEGDTPTWYEADPWAEVSDFSSWTDVAAWASPLYVVADPLPRELEILIQQWDSLGTKREKLFAAVRFVQDEIRYLGMEIGPHSLKPHSPVQTFERRFGDCKDKTLLLVAVLRRLGIQAVPALVASRDGKLLPERLPSPYAFDHVITKVTLNDVTYWFDPTIASERGDLRAHEFCDYGFALPIAADTRALEPLRREHPEKPLSEVEEHYQLGDLKGPSTLSVNTLLRGTRADEFRARYEQLSERELKRDYVNFFAKRFDGVASLGDPSVIDDERENVVRIRERYRISGLFRDGTALLSAWSFSELLEVPNIVQRKSPLKIRFPFAGQHRILLDYDVRPDFDLPGSAEQDKGLRYSVRGSETADGHHAEFTYNIESLDDSIAVDEVESHLAMRRRIDSALDIALNSDESLRARRYDAAPAWLVRLPWAIGAGLLLATALGLGLSYRRRRTFRRKQQFARGETASLPISVRSIAKAKLHGCGQRCHCNKRFEIESERVSLIRYDGQRLLALGLWCSTCGNRTLRYYACSEMDPTELEC